VNRSSKSNYFCLGKFQIVFRLSSCKKPITPYESAMNNRTFRYVHYATREADALLKQIKKVRDNAKKLKSHFIYYSHFAQYLAAMNLRMPIR